MKLLSEACEYALRSVVWLAQNPGEAQKVREIAQATKAAPGYLVKVLQLLNKAGILSAQRGSLGGFRLERDPKSLTVLEVINAIDPIERLRTCPLRIDAHGVNLCPMHQRVDDAIAEIERSFAATTIAEVLGQSGSSIPLCQALSPQALSPQTSRPVKLGIEKPHPG